MSNYPDGMPSASNGTIELICDSCSCVWEVPVINDMGTSELADPGDDYCPNCGKEHV